MPMSTTRRDAQARRRNIITVSAMNNAIASTPVSMPAWRYWFSGTVTVPAAKR